MTIRESGYTGWSGDLRPLARHWFPIFRYGIRAVFRKKYAKLLFAFAGAPFLVFLGAIYISTKPELKMLRELVALLRNDATMFNAFFANGYLTFMVAILSLFSGAELIANDSKFHAFSFYFARPLEKRDYLLGKFAIIMFFLLLFTLVPGILLVLFKMIFTASFSFSARVLLALIGYSLLLCFFFASLTLMLSAVSASPKLVRLLVILLYMMTTPLAFMLQQITHSNYFLLLSLPETSAQLAAFLFGVRARAGYPPWLAAVEFVLLAALFFFILWKKVRIAES